MATFAPEQVAQFIQIQKSFHPTGFDGSFRRIEELSQQLPIVQREQYRLFCAFCLFKIQLSRVRLKPPRLPTQIARYHERLLADIRDLSSDEVTERWNQFKAPRFVAALELIAQGHPELTAVLTLVKSNPTGKAFLDLLSENRGRNIADFNPKFLYFLPRAPRGHFITEREYEQVGLLPKK